MPLKCSLSINCRVLICCTCHFQNALPPSLFILSSSVYRSLQCLLSALTQGGEGGHRFRLTCSVVLLGGRDTANKYHWHVWGVLTVDGPHWVFHSTRQCVLPRSTLLSLQGALQGHCSKWALHFMPFGKSSFSWRSDPGDPPGNYGSFQLLRPSFQNPTR